MGKYDKITNMISADIFLFCKAYVKLDINTNLFEKEYNTNCLSCNVKAVIGIADAGGITIDGFADYSESGLYDDTISVLIELDKKSIPSCWEDISMTLKDVIRHEIEHLTHSNGDNLKLGKLLEEDNEFRIMAKTNLISGSYYLTLPKEIDANIQGLYFRAKKQKTKFWKLVGLYLQSQDLTAGEISNIKKLWKEQIPKLGLNIK